MPWRLIDLSVLDERPAQEAAGDACLRADRLERFDLAAPPLMRFALIRLAADRHRLLLSNHHLLMDGWSMPVLVRELLTLYAQRGDAAVAAAGDAVPRLSGLDRRAGPCRGACGLAARRWRGWRRPRGWRRAIAGRASRVAPEQIVLSLGEALTRALTAQARERALTLNTVIQAAWGILLGRLTGRDDVVFGVTVAGRPAEIAGIENMVGLFINTLPLRMKLPPGQPLSELLRQTQDSQSRLMAHQHLGLAEIQQAGGTGRAVRHADGVRELSGRPRRPGGRGRRAAARPGARATMRRTIR